MNSKTVTRAKTTSDQSIKPNRAIQAPAIKFSFKENVNTLLLNQVARRTLIKMTKAEGSKQHKILACLQRAAL